MTQLTLARALHNGTFSLGLIRQDFKHLPRTNNLAYSEPMMNYNKRLVDTMRSGS